MAGKTAKLPKNATDADGASLNRISLENAEFCDLTESQFRRFAAKHPHKSFFQTPEIAKLREWKGWRKHYVGLVGPGPQGKTSDRPGGAKGPGKATKGAPQGQILAATMMVSYAPSLGQRIFYAPRGVLIDYTDAALTRRFFTDLKHYARQHQGYIFRMDPYLELHQRDIDGQLVPEGLDNTPAVENLLQLGFRPEKKPEQLKWMFVLDIDGQSISQLRANFRPNTRNLINKAEKSGITIRQMSYDELPLFKELSLETAERKHFPDKDLSYYQNMHKLFHPKGQVMYLLAELNLKDYLKKLKKSLKEASLELIELNLAVEKSKAPHKGGKQAQAPSRASQAAKTAKVAASHPQKATKSAKAATQNAVKAQKLPTPGQIRELEAKVAGIKKRIATAEQIRAADGEKIALSCGMFLTYGDEVLYLIAGNREKYMQFDAQYLIQWWIINYAVEQGFRRYNFYGISGNFDKKDPAYGMYEFKKGFGGRVVELVGGFELPVTPYYYLHKFLKKLKR